MGKQYEGRFSVQLSHGSSRSDDGRWTLRVQDTKSLAPIFEAELTPFEFATLVGTTMYQVEVAGTLYVGQADKWGKTHENVSVVVPGINSETWADRYDICADYLADYYAAGWVLDRMDGDGSTRSTGYNGHCQVDGGYKVVLRRWVADEWAEIDEEGD